MSGEFKLFGASGREKRVLTGWAHPLFDRLSCQKDYDPESDTTTYYYFPEPPQLRQRLVEIETDPSPILSAIRQCCTSVSLDGPEGEVEKFDQEKYKRISARVPEMLHEMQEFVACYEEEFAQKTEWQPVYPIVDEPDDFDEEESASPVDTEEVDTEPSPGVAVGPENIAIDYSGS